MAYLFDAQNYQLQWLSIPYLVVTVWLLGIATYSLLINGMRLLRAAFLLCTLSMALTVAAYGLTVSARNPYAAIALHRCSAALVPLAATGILAFVIVHLQQHREAGMVVVAAMGISLLQMPFILLTDWYVADVWAGGNGILHVDAGPLLPLMALTSLVCLAVSGAYAYRHLASDDTPQRIRQLRRLMLSFALFSLSSVDTLLAYGIGSFPLSWLFAALGTGVLLRALIADESIHSRSLDYQAPLIVGYLLAATAGLWLVWTFADDSPLLLALLSIGVYTVLRIGLAFREMRTRAQSLAPGDTPRERLIDKYVTTVQSLYSDVEIAEATRETLTLGLGCKDIDLFSPLTDSWLWTTVEGAVLAEDAIPDPLTGMWLIDFGAPLQRIELAALGLDDFREVIEELMDANAADVFVPLINRDEILGLVILGQFPTERALSREELRFLARVQEHLTSALVYARMHSEANTRVAMQKEVALAAAIQKAFVSSAELVDYGDIQVSGLWAPATQCGGDWWSVHRLPDERVLVLIGDVTGHGVAAAMVTAAAKGCYDVVQRLMGNKLDLEELLEHLDATVRLVGAQQFNMTCFASLIDPKTQTVTFANAGHAAPYVCTPTEKGFKLGSLIARGNPLGASEPVYRSRERKLASGDILIWYTDGITECTNSQERQYGDRRMQRLLKKIDPVAPNARSVRNYIIREIAQFRGDQPPDDDITLVVAHLT